MYECNLLRYLRPRHHRWAGDVAAARDCDTNDTNQLASNIEMIREAPILLFSTKAKESEGEPRPYWLTQLPLKTF
jgi:hypothetical protein